MNYNYGLDDVSSQYLYDTTTVGPIMPEGFYIWLGIAAVIAVIGGILLYFLFVKSKDQPKGKFAKWLKDFLNFRIMWIEPILKVVYYILTIGVILGSFGFLALGAGGIIAFFLCLILGPIIVRLGYEGTMMFIMIWRNTQDISDHTKKK